MRHAQAAELGHQPLQDVGDDDTGNERGQNPPEKGDHQEGGGQQQNNDDGFFIRKIAGGELTQHPNHQPCPPPLASPHRIRKTH